MSHKLYFFNALLTDDDITVNQISLGPAVHDGIHNSLARWSVSFYSKTAKWTNLSVPRKHDGEWGDLSSEHGPYPDYGAWVFFFFDTPNRDDLSTVARLIREIIEPPESPS